MGSQSQVLAKVQEYAQKIAETDYGATSKDGEKAYETLLNRTLYHLENQVQQHKDALEKLRANFPNSTIKEPSHDPSSRIHQLKIITAAYKSLSIAEPILPLADSPLPALLALRSTHSLIDETKASLLTTKIKLSEARALLLQENKYLQDAHLLSNALKERVEKLQAEEAVDSRISPTELVQGFILHEQTQKRHYVRQLRNLVRVFNRFIEEHLAGMLAVEELGGPVVGDMLEVDEATLKAGFNQQGKAKKYRVDTASSESERQRRIKDTWGPAGEDDEAEADRRTEKSAAGAAFRTLSEDLLNAAAGDDGSDPYVRIPQETAAVRFLVRAKVAQFHPQDARKLRLVDFIGELDA